MPDDNQIIALLTKISSDVGNLTGRMGGLEADNRAAADSRRILYDRMEKQDHAIQTLDQTVEINTQLTAQTREEVKALRTEQVTANDAVKPLLDLKEELPRMVEVWRDMRKSSQRLVWILGLGGITTIAGGFAFAQSILDWLQHLGKQ